MNAKRFSRILSLLLAFLMIAPALVSCKKEKTDVKPDRETEAEEYTGENGYVLAVNDYNGTTFAITGAGFGAEEETGDSLNDATFRRNSKVAELYNIKLEFPELTETEDSKYMDLIRMALMSGDDAYQLIGIGGGLVGEALDGQYFNLNELPYFDFDQAWWPSEYMKNANIGNKLFFAVGNLDQDYYDHFVAMVFNKHLAEDYGITGLYDTVRAGEWTIDKLIEYSKRAAVDLNGDGRMESKDDQFGFAIQRRYPTDAFVTAFDIQLTGTDENGLPEILPLSDKYVAVFEKLNDFYYSDYVTYNIAKSPMEDQSFIEGRALFEGTRMFFIVGYRAMENDFGVLPYPKWDENQKDYRTFTDTDCIMTYSIPITTDSARSANIMEALSYFGYQMVRPVYYDKVLKGKTVRDEESRDMLDIIYNNISYEFCQIYMYMFYPSPDLLLGQALWNADTITHQYNQRRRMYAAVMKKLIKQLDIEGD